MSDALSVRYGWWEHQSLYPLWLALSVRVPLIPDNANAWSTVVVYPLEAVLGMLIHQCHSFLVMNLSSALLIGFFWSENTSHMNWLTGTWMVFIIINNPDNWRFQDFQDAYLSIEKHLNKWTELQKWISYSLSASVLAHLFVSAQPDCWHPQSVVRGTGARCGQPNAV